MPSRFTTTSFSGRALRSVMFDSPDRQSLAAGVGSSRTAVRRSGPPVPCRPGPFVSEVRGVGSSGEDEEPPAFVRGADVRRAKSAPLDIEPEGGKVGEDVGKSESKVP
ncbi:hypothetical protein ACIQXD_04455 [Streptomyces uncialis]|uniref:hypothetical protein n=1 Tax=Streptomyces uncialis TaxID=1048205 RepID=UPI00381582B5